jgi:hypothetical protein
MSAKKKSKMPFINADEDTIRLEIPECRGDEMPGVKLIREEVIKFRDEYLAQALEVDCITDFMLIKKDSFFINGFGNIYFSTILQISLNYYSKSLNEAFIMALTRDGNIFVSKDLKVKRGYWE